MMTSGSSGFLGDFEVPNRREHFPGCRKKTVTVNEKYMAQSLLVYMDSNTNLPFGYVSHVKYYPS